MEKKECSSLFSVVVTTVSFLSLIACAVACFAVFQVKGARQEAVEARGQLSALNQALKTEHSDLSKIQDQLEATASKLAEIRGQNEALSQQLASLPSKQQISQPMAQMNFPPVQFQFQAPMADVPAADSVEGKLRADGKNWERTRDEIVPGGYVEDVLAGRMNQPQGRGHIGKILSLGLNETGRPCATVDFGRGFSTGIMLSELAPVRIVAPDVR
jgi:hypothetical protein